MSDYYAVTFASWNVNGLGSNRYDELLAILEIHNFPKIVCLQETHSKNRDVIQSWANGLKMYSCYFNNGDGRNRGTAVLIHKSIPFKLLMEIQDWQEGRFTILKGRLFNNLVTIASIYAPVEDKDKPWFFERVLSCNLEGVKIIMGDFNSVIDPSLDRSRPSSKVKSLLDFVEFTDTIDTWRTLNPNTRVYTYGDTSRIDLILVSGNFKNHLHNASVEPKYFSDHRLIKVSINFSNSLMGKDFRKIRPSTIAADGYDKIFQLVWNRSLEYFRNEIKAKLENGTFEGDPREILDSSTQAFNYSHPIFLNNLTLGPDWWDTFKMEILEASLEFQRKNLSEKKHLFHCLQRDFYRMQEGSEGKVAVEKQLAQLLKQITSEFNFQKSKDKRLTHERYSAGFFRQTSKDRRIDFMTELKGFNNEVLTDRTEIQDHLLLQYFYLYQDDSLNDEHLDYFLQYTPKLKTKENTSPFTFSEAYEAIKALTPKTCPGPDGIPGEFYKKYFHVFGHFYVRMLNNCIENNVVPKSWETSILKVIPKVPGEIPSFDTLRPLTLGNVDCKHEASMFARRMAVVANEVIHGLQTGGLPGRQIQQSTFLIHLLINFYKENNLGGYIVALDNIKAFDKLIRQFMWIVLKEMGFDPWTIKAIQNLYRKTSVRLILNGFLSEPFSTESGVKQGCPLSALLFIITMEPLARSIMEDPLLKNCGFRLPGNKEVHLMQHLDDMTLFACDSQAIHSFMSKVLKFSSLSGATINYKKSFIIRLDRQSNILSLDGEKICNIPVIHKNACRKILGIYFGSDIEGYIEKNWWEVYNKCMDVLKVWTICFSSEGFTSLMGRALVVHVMVHSKINYLMQCMQFFSEAIDEINKEVHKFLWAGKTHIPKLNLAVLEAPLKMGGIGIKPLDHRAISLRFSNIKNIFVRNGENWIAEKSPAEAIICYFLDISVRNLVPNMDRTTLAPLNLAAKYYKPGPIQFIGHLPKIFDVIYWDIERAITLIGSAEYLENYSPKIFLEDLMERRTLKLRSGSIKKAYISRFCFPSNVEAFLWENILHKLLEPKLKAFAYKLSHDCLPTKYAIWRIMSHFPDNQRDPFCKFCNLVLLTNIDCNALHIFKHCPVARDTWNIINSRLKNAQKPEYKVTEKFIYFRFGLDKYDSYFVTEILWALWRVNNYNNYEIADQTNRLWTVNNVLEIAKNRLKYVSNIDKHICSARVYKRKWDRINTLLGFVYDNG